MDVAFSAGVLVSKTQNHAQEESLRFSSSLPDSQMREELSRARKRQAHSLLNYSISSIKMKRYLPIQIVSSFIGSKTT